MNKFKLLMIMMAIPFSILAHFDDKTIDQILSKDYVIPVKEVNSFVDSKGKIVKREYEVLLINMQNEQIAECSYSIYLQKVQHEKSCFGIEHKNKDEEFQKVCEIGLICINKKYTNQRIGTALMNHIIDHARKEKCEKISLDSVFTAISFYEKLGFDRISQGSYSFTKKMEKDL